MTTASPKLSFLYLSFFSISSKLLQTTITPTLELDIIASNCKQPPYHRTRVRRNTRRSKMLSYIVAIVSALVASPATPLLADFLCLLFTLVFLYTSILDSFTVTIFMLVKLLSELISGWYARRQEARALVTSGLEERPRRKVDFTPRRIPHPHDWMLRGDPNEQFHFETRSKIWDKPIKHLSPASPEITSVRPATPMPAIAYYDPPRTPAPKKPLTPAENAKANLAKKKLFESLEKPEFCKHGVMLQDDDLEQHYIKELSVSTGLNAKDSRACLKANGWKFDAALKDFRRLQMIDAFSTTTGIWTPP